MALEIADVATAFMPYLLEVPVSETEEDGTTVTVALVVIKVNGEQSLATYPPLDAF